ncbi:molybdopterin oxidoreductase family protein [Cellulomonas fengjieae]|uniref:Molybdopterin oxidoreductase family protein n=1 Tax=Cellulomonas fengjieae TaxID=2819978 RepID=A0ABS3SDG2_9CELL|nr:molybdopterin oxidoreductase family protein [Cellulomonas fengjieae]MBO3083783.1 molybdopterin oxidoreductase family protein [Cellulomonas fengjieae]MBO3101468.1 molybdopterin oxidoreductase family protein [Cellulomonas fengjieae]QVI64926.1 molybdopterin oxidoreductase family protein [Cellulomonas fengjieae]
MAGPAADTHCPYCALQCAQTLHPGADGTVTAAGRQFPTNRGGMCQKGWTSPAVLRAADRLTTPLLRGQPVSWDTALSFVADRLTSLRATHGAGSVAVFGGGGLTNEKAYALGKFARAVLATPNIDYNGRFCMASAAAGANRSLGLDRGLPFPLADLGGARAVLLLGSNLAETMPPAVQHLAGVRAAGGLIVVDPRRSATADLTADDGGLHVQPVPGTDLALLLGLAHIVLAEGFADQEYLAARTTGLDDVRRSLALWWPERTEQVTGVPVATLRRAAFLLANASPSRGGAGAYVLTGRGVEQSTQGTDTVTAAITLALLLGLPGRVGSGYGAITGQGNGQGGREHGQKADQLPGYRSIEDEAARAHVAGVWGVDPADLPRTGMPAVELLRSLGTPDGPKALLVHGSNLVVSAPDADRVRERLASLDLLVVCDFLPSETALLADVVLPVTQWAEEEGTMTSLEGRVLRRRRAVPPPPGVRSELEVLADLARRLGSSVHFDTSPAAVFDELARASAGGRADYSGLSHARLDAEPDLFWPVPAGPTPHPGTPRLFLDRFATPDGRARLVPVDHRGPSDDLRRDAPLFLVTGRVLAHYQSGAQTRRVPELVRSAPEPYVEVHPLLADLLGIGEGDPVQLDTARGRGVVRARLTDAVRADTVFLPFHWAGTGSANRLTTDATDPVSGMPEFKVCAVAVRRWDGPPDVLDDPSLLYAQEVR